MMREPARATSDSSLPTPRRTSVRILLGLCTFLLLVLAGAAAAQDWKGRGRVQGQVFDPEGKPYQGATVHLFFQGEEGRGPEAFTTDKKGRWSYLGLAGGAWTIRIETTDYVLSEGQISVNEHQAGPGQPLRIDLRRPTEEELASSAFHIIAQGNEALQNQQYAEARDFYLQALPDTPEDTKAAVLRGIAQASSLLGEKDEAVTRLEQSLELAPDDTDTLRLLIDLLLAMGRKDEAQAYMAKLPEGETLDFPSRLNLGIDLYNQGNYDGALEHFDTAVADFPDQPEGYYYQGLVVLAQEKNDEALAAFQKYLEVAPADHEKRSEVESFVEYLGSD